MELVRDLGSKEKVVTSKDGTTYTKRYGIGLYKCPSCGSEKEYENHKGRTYNSCGSKGCKSKASAKYGHRKLPTDQHINNQPHIKALNDFYRRNIKGNVHVCSEWYDYRVFRQDMLDSYRVARDEFGSATLFVKGQYANRDTAHWVEAKNMLVTDYSDDISNGIYHTKMLSTELGMQHHDVVKSLKRIDGIISKKSVELLPNLGYLAKPDKGYMLTKEEYLRVKNKILDYRKGKQSSIHVYLIESMGLIKIGITSNIKTRIATIRGMCPGEVREVFNKSITGAANVEKYLHNKYSDVNAHHEWFNLSEEQVAEIIDYLDNQP